MRERIWASAGLFIMLTSGCGATPPGETRQEQCATEEGGFGLFERECRALGAAPAMTVRQDAGRVTFSWPRGLAGYQFAVYDHDAAEDVWWFVTYDADAWCPLEDHNQIASGVVYGELPGDIDPEHFHGYDDGTAPLEPKALVEGHTYGVSMLVGCSYFAENMNGAIQLDGEFVYDPSLVEEEEPPLLDG